MSSHRIPSLSNRKAFWTDSQFLHSSCSDQLQQTTQLYVRKTFRNRHLFGAVNGRSRNGHLSVATPALVSAETQIV